MNNTLVAVHEIQEDKVVVSDQVINSAIAGASIVIDNVSVSFKTSKGSFTAVKDINLTVRKGEIISLIGHSGCGKSTLMGTISGMVKPTSGTVKASGELVTKPGPD